MMIPRLSSSVSTLSALAFAAMLAACGCGPKRSVDPIPNGPSPGGPTGDDVGTVDLAKLGTPCGDGDRCEGGGSCVKYYGIAGPSGPEFSSCELACPNGKGPCPTGASCVTIADGPGSVCRATDVLEGGPSID